MKNYLFAVAVVSLMLLAACQAPSAQVNQAPPAAPAAGAQANVQVNTAPDNAGAQPAPAAAAGTASDLKAILAHKLAQYKVSYDTTANGVTTSMTYVMALPKFAVETAQGGMDVKMVMDGTNYYVCYKQAQWSCMKSATAQSAGTMDTEKSLTQPDVVPTPAGTCTHAGETGTAYDVTAQGVTSHVCVTSDGILLEVKSTTQGVSTSMVATSVSRTVTDADFALPATPTAIPAYPQG